MRKILAVLFAACLVPSLFAQGTGTPVQTATVTLSSAQLQHLGATPVQLVPAPGSGKLLNLVSIVAQYKFGSAAYALANGGQFTTALGSASIGINLAAAGFIDKTTNQIQFNGGSAGGAQGAMENQPLMISNDGAGEWISGDGTVIVTVYYTVVDLQ